MPPFRFRLATLLKIREGTRDERRSALAEAQYAQRLLEEQIAEVRDDLRELKRDYQASARPGKISVDRLLDAQRFELVLLSQLKHLDRQRETVVGEVARRRELLVEADREVKILEKLREKQAQRALREDDLKEIKRLDELAGRSHATEEVS